MLQGTFPKEKRESCSPVVATRYPRPGPADYQSLEVKTSTERPLSAQKSFGQETFNRAKKEILQYSHEFESAFKGKLGPGPAAYQKLEILTDEKLHRVNSDDRMA